MTEYIDREEAMFCLSKWLEKASNINNRGSYNFGEIAAYQTAIEEINSFPAADVRPVVRGEWEPLDAIMGLVCPNCGFWYRPNAARSYYVSDRDFSFCPYCGADMRKDGAE